MKIHVLAVLQRIGLAVLVAGSMQSLPAQQSKDVNVVNTPSVTVANTPSVNVANTPTVNVGNTASVNVANTPSVQVKNDTTTPVITQDNDNPARHFFQKNFSFVVQDGSFSGTADLGTSPANAVLVIEYINMQVRLPGQENVTEVVFTAGAFDNLGFAPVETISNTGTDSTWVVDRQVKMYVAPNTPMTLFFGRTSSVGISQFGSVEISGYLVSTP